MSVEALLDHVRGKLEGLAGKCDAWHPGGEPDAQGPGSWCWIASIVDTPIAAGREVRTRVTIGLMWRDAAPAKPSDRTSRSVTMQRELRRAVREDLDLGHIVESWPRLTIELIGQGLTGPVGLDAELEASMIGIEGEEA